MPAFTDIREKFELQPYTRAGKANRKDHLPFSGSPRKHPHDPDRIILVADPFTATTFYYEFRVEDIGFAEELPSISNLEGESVPMARIWVRKNSLGIRSIPFRVEDLSSIS